MANNAKISKFWLVFNIVMTLMTGGFWLIPVVIWFLMVKAKK